jgi:predicted RNA-binding Zn ribbon-like protein
VESLPFDPGDYDGTYKLVGGRVSLDLVNTVSWPSGEHRHDWFDQPANVTAWWGAVGLAPVRSAAVDPGVVRGFRGVLTDVLRPLAHGDTPDAGAVARFNELLAAARARRLIDPTTLDWTWLGAERAEDVLAPVVVDAAEVITSGRERLKHCPSCDWLFEDHTRNGARRWCDMADCGSRAKARAYYRRRTTS